MLMSRFATLASSSNGNSIYVAGGDHALLVDCGISYRRIKTALSGLGVDPNAIQGVIITHEHSDHVKGLNTFLTKHPVPVYSSEETLRYLCVNDLIPRDAFIVPLESPTCIADIAVTPFDTPHDAVHSIGVRLEMPDGRKLAIATDLGHISDTVRQHLTGCDLVMLESNYDPGMLYCSRYPYYLKQRIKSEWGHLANSECADEITRLVESGSTRFVLGHLSEQNNVPQLAAQTSRAALALKRMREMTDYILSVAPARTPHEMVVF